MNGRLKINQKFITMFTLLVMLVMIACTAKKLVKYDAETESEYLNEDTKVRKEKEKNGAVPFDTMSMPTLPKR